MIQTIDDWFERNANLDGFLVTKSENIYYLSGFQGSFGLVWWERSGKKYLITDGRYREKAEAVAATSGFEFVVFDADFKTNWAAQKSGNFAIENSLTLSDLTRWEGIFGSVKFKPESGTIESMRRIKTPEEIQKIATAQAQVDQVLLPFLKENLKLGVTEQALNFRLQQTLQAEGRFGLSFPSIIAFGKNSSRPHHESGDKALKLGDNVLVDCGVTNHHYCSDMTRNFIFGEADPAYVAKYEKLLHVQERTTQRMVAGVPITELETRCREDLGEDSAYFTHSLGHGVGLEIHEMPSLSKQSKDTLHAGEIVTNEPGIYYPDQFGIRIEDLLVITGGKPQILSQFPRDLLNFAEDGSVQTLIKGQ